MNVTMSNQQLAAEPIPSEPRAVDDQPIIESLAQSILSRARRSAPVRATYRLQFTAAQFRFDDAARQRLSE